MDDEVRVGPTSELPPGRVVGVGHYAVGNASGTLFAVGRRCRHLRADLGGGSIDEDDCLVCPWHGAKYDVGTGRMVRGPQGAFKPISGVIKATTGARPLQTYPVEVRDGAIWLAG